MEHTPAPVTTSILSTSTMASSSSPISSLFSVAGKNVLVTGGSRGIGLMIAKGFVQAGANVILTSRDEKACSKAASEIQCRYVTSTLSTRQGCEMLAASVKDMFDSRLDVLINNVRCFLHVKIFIF